MRGYKYPADDGDDGNDDIATAKQDNFKVRTALREIRKRD